MNSEVSMFRRENIPNFISTARLVLSAPLLIALHYAEATIWFLVVAALLGLSDWVDGYLARKNGWTSYYGKVIDPLADKAWAWPMTILMLSEHSLYGELFWPLMAYLVYDVATIVMRLFTAAESANEYARWKTMFLYASLILFGCAMVWPPLVQIASYGFWTGAVLILPSAIVYLLRYVRRPAFS
jgi:cardiolipin synthase